MANSVSFLHLADLHIGLRASCFEEQIAKKIREARFIALDNALKIAKEKGADFIIIAGDLFDDNAVSAEDAGRVFDLLKGKTIPIYVVPGNHDPYSPGSVWHRRPWCNWNGTAIQLLHERKFITFRKDVILFPCPVSQKKSTQDPTAWILADRQNPESIRIGVAHGSVMDRENLPQDDHLIPMACAEIRNLDYVALGHWHALKFFRDKDDIGRMAYSGTHEKWGFANSKFSLGWQAYSTSPEREEFLGASGGKALWVQITRYREGSEVKLQEENVGHYLWDWESYDDIDDKKLEIIFSELARRKDTERRLLHLEMKGVLSGESLIKMDGFEKMLNRYLYCELDKEGLHIKPDDQEMERVMGAGVMRQLFLKLKEEKEKNPNSEENKIIEATLITLYRLAKEMEP